MTRNVSPLTQKQMKTLLAEKRRLKAEKELLTALCLVLTVTLGLILILI